MSKLEPQSLFVIYTPNLGVCQHTLLSFPSSATVQTSEVENSNLNGGQGEVWRKEGRKEGEAERQIR